MIEREVSGLSVSGTRDMIRAVETSYVDLLFDNSCYARWPCFQAASRYSHYYSSCAYMHSPIMVRLALVHMSLGAALNIGSGSHTHNYAWHSESMLAKVHIMPVSCSVL